MKKIYIINKPNDAITIFYDSKDAAMYLWGRPCSQHAIIVSNKHGDTLIPLEMTKGDVESIRLIISSFDDD